MRWLLLVLLLVSPPAVAGEKHGAIVLAPIRHRTFQDILSELAPAEATGTIVVLDGMTMTLRRRDGTLALINFEAAARSPEFPPIGTGKAVTCVGSLDKDGILHARLVWPAQ